jgi:predicted small secreted protein
MKSTVTLLATTVLAAFALVGCNQNTPGNSTDTQSTNSSMTDASGTTGGITNMPATNSMPVVNTNMPAGTNQ